MNLNPFQWRSLKTRVTLFTLAIFLVSIWSLAFYARWMLRADMERVLGDQQLSTVAVLAEELQHELSDRMIVLEKVARRIDPAMLADPRALQDFIERHLMLQEQAFNGGVIVYALDGTAIAEVSPSSERLGVNYMEIDTVAAALREGASSVSRPVMGKKLQAPVFGITVPIHDGRGKVIGALGGVVNLGLPNFLDRITTSRYGKTGGYVLVAPQYRLIVTATDKSRVMASFPEPGVNPTIDRFIGGFEGPVVYVSAVGAEILTSSKRIPVAGWDIVAILPTSEAFAPIRAMQRRMLLATLLLTVLAAALTWWMLKRQLAPALDAARALSSLSDANEPPRALPITRADEIGELVGGFNRLLEALTAREKELQESEAFKNSILNAMAARIAVVNCHGDIQAVNKRWWQATVAEHEGGEPGKPTPHSAVGDNYLEFFAAGGDFASPEQALRARQGIQAVLDGSLPSFSLDYAADSSQQNRWFTLAVMPLGRDSGHGAVITHSEVTAIKRAEQYEHCRSRVLELLATDQALGDILEAIVLGVEQLDPAMLCSILLLDREGKRLTTGAAPSLPDFFNSAIDGSEIGADVGSCGAAAFSGERVVVADIATHPFWRRARKLAARAGLGACWSEPIRASSGQVLGTFAIYHRQAHTPSDADIAIIEQSARLASIAIEKNLAAEKLRDSEAHYRLLTETVSDIVWRQDRKHYFTYISPADERLRGYPASEVIGRHVTEVLPAEGVALLRETQRRREEAERSGIRTSITRFELPQLCKDGRLIWLEVLSTPERDAHGTITGYHGISREITSRKHEQDQVRQLAFYDPLTALPNRRLLNDRLRQTMAASTRTGCYGAVMFVDLDNFKPLNDQSGHVAGDLLLIEAAQRLKACVREMDTVARFGGDEFVVVINELDVDRAKSTDSASAIAEKIRTSLSKPYLLTVRREGEDESRFEHRCSASIGVALFIDHQASQDEILKWADRAMYEAKQAGRNVIRLHARDQPRGRSG
ncbi:MAG: diguanylate cyclase [Candidatus Accumulibacter sp.]|uniref:sensor domain-containing diguanylate cyclase n=1 Tax=Accumulibacter sp. TaxID=2053492 RepID=UPI0025EBACE3|nr:diguanylate cyclase [Accumulibacter sp.]MCP5249983.1 diguanylate cyclase [Accumulibacter sp.]